MAKIKYSQRNPQTGFSLIELIIFLMVAAIIIATLSTVLTSSLSKSPDLLFSTQANYLARERMELIQGYRQSQGFSAINASNYDPCLLSSPSSAAIACTSVPTGFIINSSFTGNWGGDTNFAEITVTVSGKGSSSLSTLLASY